MYRDGIDNVRFATDAKHDMSGCTGCHGGVDGTDDRAAAHAGMQRIPGAASCAGCHASIATSAAGSLHTTVSGYEAVLAARGFDFTAGSASAARYQKQCTRCHVANAADEAACGHCHLSVPNSAGGGLLKGHRALRTPDMANNCTACHGSRVKDEYFGLNQALLVRNRAALPADSFLQTATLAPDVHKTAGMDCAACHTGGEMHGNGVTAGIDRYGLSGTPECRTCHATLSTRTHHSEGHLGAMDCQVCHAQPYKSCFGCHTDVDGSSNAFYKINENDPTRAARQGTATTLPAGDALMEFRVGRNPLYGDPGQKEYSVLRHAPVDADVFRYTGANEQTGLIPSLTALPTWKHATPHSIARVTPIQSACDNCHAASYARFWLTDPVANAQGWVGAGAAAQQAERDANAGVLQAAPPAMTWTR